jgi:hypothetical protein
MFLTFSWSLDYEGSTNEIACGLYWIINGY